MKPPNLKHHRLSKYLAVLVADSDDDGGEGSAGSGGYVSVANKRWKGVFLV